MPETSSNRTLDSLESGSLGDLFGIKRDLESVVQFAERLVRAFELDPVDTDLLDALSTACVVRYCRCFDVGVRAKLARASVGAIDPRFIAFHDYIFALRQKHLSHSVNEFEANVVAVTLAEPPAPPEVLDIRVVGGRVAGLDKDTAKNLRVLAKKLLTVLSEDLETERLRIRSIVRALPLEELYRLPVAPEFNPSWERAAVKRVRRGT